MHAVIEVAGPDDITLIDLGNDPGTLVNGARVNKCKLHVGDKIEIGYATQIMLESARAEAEAVAPSVPPPMQRGPVASNPFAAAAGGSNPLAASANPFGGAPAAASVESLRQAANLFAAAQSPFAWERRTRRPTPARGTRASGTGHGHGVPSSDAPPGSCHTYTLIKSGPDVASDEVELAHVQAVEVMVLWGSNVLRCVSHLTPPRELLRG